MKKKYRVAIMKFNDIAFEADFDEYMDAVKFVQAVLEHSTSEYVDCRLSAYKEEEKDVAV